MQEQDGRARAADADVVLRLAHDDPLLAEPVGEGRHLGGSGGGEERHQGDGGQPDGDRSHGGVLWVRGIVPVPA
jgi:hypothetical protein